MSDMFCLCQSRNSRVYPDFVATLPALAANGAGCHKVNSAPLMWILDPAGESPVQQKVVAVFQLWESELTQHACGFGHVNIAIPW